MTLKPRAPELPCDVDAPAVADAVVEEDVEADVAVLPCVPDTPDGSTPEPVMLALLVVELEELHDGAALQTTREPDVHNLFIYKQCRAAVRCYSAHCKSQLPPYAYHLSSDRPCCTMGTRASKRPQIGFANSRSLRQTPRIALQLTEPRGQMGRDIRSWSSDDQVTP